MKIFIKLLKIIGIYLGVSLIIALIVGCVFYSVPDAITGNSFYYRFCNGWLFFFMIFPGIQLSAIVLSCSYIFGRECKLNLPRFSASMFDNFIGVILASLVLTGLSFGFKEIGIPLVERAGQRVLERTEKYTEYFKLAQRYSDDENFSVAMFYVEHSLLQNPQSEEALELRGKIESNLSDSSRKTETPVAEKVGSGATDLTSSLSNGFTTAQLMENAKKAYESGDYFDAHYYATLVCLIGEQTDGNMQTARLLASDAWNKLSNVEVSETENNRLFRKKREGYIALLNGNWLHAYYVFNELEKNYPSDPDVTRYSQISKEKLDGEYFFIDETLDLQTFETAVNVYFTVPRLDDGRDVVSIKGITAVEKAGSLVQYLRGLTVSSYNENGEFLQSFTVPYAKMYAQELSDFDLQTQNEYRQYIKGNSVPYIMLLSVDREFEDVMNIPEFKNSDYLENETNDDDVLFSQYILTMPYDDISLIIDASQGAETMPLVSLAKFISVAQKYGYSSEVYCQAFVSRITFPFFVLILSLVAGIIGWNYRIGKEQVFKFQWLFLLPILLGLSYFLFEIFRSFQILLNFALVGGLAFTAVFVAPVFYVVILIIISIAFLAQRGE